MKISSDIRQQARRYFQACLGPDGTVSEESIREIIDLIAQKKPRNYLPLLAWLEKLLTLAIEERTVTIEYADALPDNGDQIIAELSRHYGPASRVFLQQNSSLLGGLRVRRGSLVWDGTVATRLERLKNLFN